MPPRKAIKEDTKTYTKRPTTWFLKLGVEYYLRLQVVPFEKDKIDLSHILKHLN